MVSSWRGAGTLVLVTHALTVGPLTGFLPEQAETVVLQPTPGNPRGEVLGQDRATPIGTCARADALRAPLTAGVCRIPWAR